MSTKVLQDDASTVQIVATGAFTAGVGLLTGQLFGVPENSGTTGDPITLRVRGVVTIAKVGSLAVAVGDVLYWVPGTSNVDKTSAAQKEVGYAVSATGSGAGETLVDMLLSLQPRTSVAA